jgi:hypothetical protein
LVGIAGLGQHCQQLGEALGAVLDPPLGDQVPVLVDQGDVVMQFRPVDSAEHPQPIHLSVDPAVHRGIDPSGTRGALIARLCGLPSD